jgi:hypothetical protein
MDQSLVTFDTDRIKDYVFATSRLTEIRGASGLLEELNRNQTERVILTGSPGADIIYHHGGSSLALVPTSNARPLIAAVEAVYRQQTQTATVSGFDQPYHPDRPFGEQVREAFLKLRRVKDERSLEAHVLVSPWLRICDACGQYPASHAHGEQLVCTACKTKREQGTEKRTIFWQEFLKAAQQVGDNHWRDAQLPRDLDDIGAVSRPPGYIGFLYADANNMGRVLRKLQRPEQFKAFAEAVDWLTRDVVHQALRRYTSPRPINGRDVTPFEILLMGGDDLMLMTGADLAVEVATDIVRSFERRAPEKTGHKLTLSLGLVLAHARFPIRAMYELASDLLRSAKGKGGSALDFAIVTAAGSRNLEWLREEVLTDKSFQVRPRKGCRYRLTQRPYSLADFEKLCRHARQLHAIRFPQSQLQGLYEGLFISGIEASIRAITVVGRANKEHEIRLRSFFSDFGSLPIPVPPWRTEALNKCFKQDDECQKQCFSTALGDLVELYRFVAAEAKGEEDAGDY